MQHRLLTGPADPYYPQAAAIYAQSFPLHEQRLPHQQEAAWAHPQYRYHLFVEDQELVGVLLTWETEDFCYVEHFAISAQVRGRQFGSRILQQYCQQQASDGRRVILEIDPPADDLSRRRQAFYQRLGFAECPFSHRHPAYRPGFPPHPLVVLSFPQALSPEQYAAFSHYLQQVVMQDSPQ